MAGETIKGLNVVLGADTTALSAALADVNKSSRGIASELRQVENALKFNPKSTELLAQKQKLLGDQVATTRKKLEQLQSVQQQIGQGFSKGDISEGQYRAFQREIVETESKLKHFETQLKNSQGFVSFADKMDQAGKKMQELGNKATQAGKNLSMAVTLPVLGAGAAAFKMAADVEDALGATEQTYGHAAEAMKKWANSLESYYGIAENEALEYGNMMGSMLKNIGGLTEEQAADQAQTLIKLAGDLTAMYGGTTADAVRALTGALKGNNTMLDNYGMAANDAMVKTKAFEMGLYSGAGQMDLAAKQAATLALIMEQSGAAQGQAAREANGASGSMREFVTELKNLATSFRQILLPVITPLIAKLSEMVKRFRELSPAAKQTIVIVAGVAAAIGPLLIGLGKLTSAVGVLLPVISKIGPAFGKIKTALASVSLSAVGTVAGIAALAIIAIEVYRNWEQVGAALGAIWGLIKTSATQLSLNVAIVFERMKEAVLGAINGILERLTALEGLPLGIGEKFAGLKDAISNSTEQSAEKIGLLEKAAEENKKQMQEAAEGTKVAFSDLGQAIVNDVKGIINAFKGQTDAVKEQTNALATEAGKQTSIIETKSKEALKFEADWNQRLLELNEQYSLSRTRNAKEEAEVQLQILERQKQEALAKAQELGASTVAIQDYFALQEQKILEKRTQAMIQTFQKWIGFASDVSSGLQSIDSQRYQNQQIELDNYYEKEKERIENSLLSEEEKEAQLAALEADVEKRRKKAARDQAKDDKEFAVFNAIIHTAQAILRTFAQFGWPQGIIPAAVMAALGAAQLKAIKAQPLPALAEGGLATRETLARIGERKDRIPEAVLPLTQKILSGIGEGIAANMPQQAGDGGMTVNLHVHGNIIGDKAGMRKLAQEVFSYEYSVKRRLGGAEA